MTNYKYSVMVFHTKNCGNTPQFLGFFGSGTTNSFLCLSDYGIKKRISSNYSLNHNRSLIFDNKEDAEALIKIINKETPYRAEISFVHPQPVKVI